MRHIKFRVWVFESDIKKAICLIFMKNLKKITTQTII